jgi:hypothetical protein
MWSDEEDFYEDNEEFNGLMDSLIEQGYINPTGVDESGELLYQTTPKFREDFPEMFAEQIADTNRIIYDLWMLGLVDVTVKEEVNDWVVLINDKTLTCDLDNLTQEQKNIINQLRYKALYSQDDTI